MVETARAPCLSSYVRNGIGHLVGFSSLRQTFTGFLTTGALGSLKYAFQKLKKAFGAYWEAKYGQATA